MADPQLSVVVVAYDMPRQIVRTVRSLSPAMQRGIAAGDYELLVVDNGSPQPIDRAACEGFGARIRWLEVERPTPSPAPAANLGLAEARGALIGVFIDGARMASPGMLAHALAAARLHERAVISTLSFHLGRRPQYVAAASGHDEQAEAALLATVDWERDGYRLFDVAVPGHPSFTWFRRPFETNGLFMPAALWTELGGFDERFSSAGGGLVNPDVFIRATALPDVQPVSLLGEATFHQVHGGVSTNRTVAEAPLDEWHAEYAGIRGQRFAGGAEPILSVGTPDPAVTAAILRDGADAAVTLASRYVDVLKASLDGAVPRDRLDALGGCVRAALDEGVAGDLVDVGSGSGAVMMAGLLVARGVGARRVWVAADDRAGAAARLQRLGLLDERVEILEGSPADAPAATIAVLRLDGDREATATALATLYDRVAPGGHVVADGDAATAAAEAFRTAHGIGEPLVRAGGAGLQWRRAEAAA